MRKLILSILLVSAAAAPVVAQQSDPSDRQRARAERQEAREERQSRDDRQEAREVRQPREDRQEAREVRQSRDERQQVRGDRAERTMDIGRRGAKEQIPYEARAAGRADRAGIQQLRTAREQARGERQGARQDRRETLRENREFRQGQRARPPVLRDRAPIVSNTPRPNTQPPARAEGRRYSPTRWSGDWRRNSRYDWYNYRNRYRSLFRLGFYTDPFGWGYQPYSIGWRMWPNYYRSSYWLNDPWQYRLPYAPVGTRWIRYYDDAILVDTWDGQVVDVIRNFFW